MLKGAAAALIAVKTGYSTVTGEGCESWFWTVVAKGGSSELRPERQTRAINGGYGDMHGEFACL